MLSDDIVSNVIGAGAYGCQGKKSKSLSSTKNNQSKFTQVREPMKPN